MDRMIYTALNALHNMRDSNVTTAQNLANANVPGFRADLGNNGGTKFLDVMGQASARAFQLETGPAGFSDKPGFLDSTGEPLDVAIADTGYFYVQPDSGGEPALTRRGDLAVDNAGNLRNGAGETMLDNNLEPITLPPFRDMVITELGEIIISPVNGAPGETVNVAVLGTSAPPPETLIKSVDGQIRSKDGTVPPPDQAGKVLQGMLERSNVNSVEQLLSTIENQRNFEIGLKMILTTKEIDEGGARLMQAPE